MQFIRRRVAFLSVVFWAGACADSDDFAMRYADVQEGMSLSRIQRESGQPVYRELHFEGGASVTFQRDYLSYTSAGPLTEPQPWPVKWAMPVAEVRAVVGKPVVKECVRYFDAKLLYIFCFQNDRLISKLKMPPVVI